MMFFFFQAEDGIRDGHVTGVQTCALPISRSALVETRLAPVIGMTATESSARTNTVAAPRRHSSASGAKVVRRCSLRERTVLRTGSTAALSRPLASTTLSVAAKTEPSRWATRRAKPTAGTRPSASAVVRALSAMGGRPWTRSRDLLYPDARDGETSRGQFQALECLRESYQ